MKQDYASDGRRAYPIARALFDKIIVQLRRDRRFSGVPSSDFDLLLANPLTDFERLLFRELCGHVRVEDLGEDL